MARYIDAELLRELIDFGFDVDFDEVPETKQALLEMIDYQETADVVPVVHAHWRYRYPNTSQHQTEFICSNCSRLVEHYFCKLQEVEYDFCPFCGAKMDEIYLTVRLEGE